MKIDEKKLKEVMFQAISRHRAQQEREEKIEIDRKKGIIERKAIKASETKRKIKEFLKSVLKMHSSELQVLHKAIGKNLPLFYKNRDAMDYAINRAISNTESRKTGDVWHELLKLAELPEATRPEAMTGIISKRGIQYKKDGKLSYLTRDALNMRLRRRVDAHDKAVNKMKKRTDAHG